MESVVERVLRLEDVPKIGDTLIELCREIAKDSDVYVLEEFHYALINKLLEFVDDGRIQMKDVKNAIRVAFVIGCLKGIAYPSIDFRNLNAEMIMMYLAFLRERFCRGRETED